MGYGIRVSMQKLSRIRQPNYLQHHTCSSIIVAFIESESGRSLQGGPPSHSLGSTCFESYRFDSNVASK